MEKGTFLKQKKKRQELQLEFPTSVESGGLHTLIRPLWFGCKAQQKVSREYIWIQTQVPGLLHLTPCSSSAKNVHYLFSGLASLNPTPTSPKLHHWRQLVANRASAPFRVWAVLTFQSPHRHCTSCCSHTSFSSLKPLPLHNPRYFPENFCL